mgnify:CR=1 FL=1|tara:strand:+ start:12850 stop:13296 length:447 start_codon:yes stop_codon:yes gene_type:complete
MKHLKTFEAYGTFFTVMSAFAGLKIIYNIIKRKSVVKGIKNYDFKKLEYLINQWEDKKVKLGETIDNDEISQIIYEYSGGEDNRIIFTLDKINNIFKFEWNFSQPVFPFINFDDTDNIELDLTDDQVIDIQRIFDKLKNQKFKKANTW